MSKLRELLGKDVQSTSESEWDRMLAHAVLDSYLMRNAEAIAALIEAAENAKVAVGMAYECVTQGRTDEALLHLGHHEAKLAQALSALKD
jgi:hypothetical protein